MSVSGRPARASYADARYIAAAGIIGLVLLTSAASLLLQQVDSYARFILLTQDAWLAPFFAASCLFGASHLNHERFVGPRHEQRAVWLCIALIVLICWAGRFLVFSDFDATPDERMVAFDAAIFRTGDLVWPISPEWRPFADALNRKFILPIGSAEAWISAYLPINAAFHAVVGQLVDEDLTSPLLVAAGAFCLWRISLKLWPESAGARVAALAFYAGSSQILITGMTKFAMSAHLALNLLWLLLFLRGDRASHAAAMFVGLLATGLHQPLFHPLFAVPFLALLASQRHWKLFGAYLFAYACIGTFWLSWPILMTSFGTGPAVPTETLPGVSHFERLTATLTAPDLQSAWLMGANLVRFTTWQHPLLIPLALFAGWAAWRDEPLVRALTISLLLPILLFWILLPWQGSGWGYRYLHPVLGNAILLGGWGWHLLERNLRQPWRPLLWTSIAAVFLLLPLHGWMAHRTVRPLAELDSRIAAIDADIVILDAQIFPFFAHNRPDLTNRPVRLIGSEVQPDKFALLCERGSIAFIQPPPPREPSPRQEELKNSANRAGCAAVEVRVETAEHLLRTK